MCGRIWESDRGVGNDSHWLCIAMVLRYCYTDVTLTLLGKKDTLYVFCIQLTDNLRSAAMKNMVQSVLRCGNIFRDIVDGVQYVTR